MPKFINPSKLPQPYFDAVVNDDYDPGESDYTPSSLMRPPYMSALFRDHDSKIEIDVADRFFALMGKMAHKLLEQQEKGKNAVAELRIYTKINKWVIGMQFDRLHLDKDTMSLQDWKMTTVYKFKKDFNGNYPQVEDWEIQLNIGAFILRNGGWFYDSNKEKKFFKAVEVNKLEIIGLLRDFRQSEARRNNMYPQKPVISREIEIWDNDKVVNYVFKRATQHDDSKEQNLSIIPSCTLEEMWGTNNSFAIMKVGGKKAVKAGIETYDKAVAHMESKKMDFEKYLVEKRYGERKRCAGYCDVSKFCPTYKKWLEESNKEELVRKRKVSARLIKKLNKKDGEK